MKKIKALVISIALIIGTLPSVAVASGGVPAGLTLQAWVVGPNQGGKGTSIGFKYSGGFSTNLFLNIPFDSSWKKVDPVEPILEAYNEGYGSNLGGSGGIVGTTINFAPNVLAAMKVQSFNPSQVGGADIPPSSTTLTSDQIAWLQKVGYSVPTIQSSSNSTPTTASSESASAQSPSQPSQQTASTKASASPKPETTQSQSSSASDPVGETVKTSSGPMTPEMVAANQKLAAENPPSTNPANIPIANSTQANQKHNIWIEVAVGVVVLVVAGVAGRIIYIKRKRKLA